LSQKKSLRTFFLLARHIKQGRPGRRISSLLQEGTVKLPTTFALAIFVTALSPSAVLADDQGACMQDAFSICGQFIPNRERVAACLISNRSRVSPACRNALTHFKTKTASAE
jgi:hypothetical protein